MALPPHFGFGNRSINRLIEDKFKVIYEALISHTDLERGCTGQNPLQLRLAWPALPPQIQRIDELGTIFLKQRIDSLHLVLHLVQ
jgi:hypothetical protein